MEVLPFTLNEEEKNGDISGLNYLYPFSSYSKGWISRTKCCVLQNRDNNKLVLRHYKFVLCVELVYWRLCTIYLPLNVLFY